MSTINLARVQAILAEADEIVEDLDGRSLDESDAVTEPKAAVRHEKAALSRQLQFLATRLELAAALVRSEYWTSRGFTDHINGEGR